MIAVGSSFLYPSMLLLVLRGVPEHQRGSVIGTFSAFFDFASGASGIFLGGIASLSSYPGAFGASAVLAGVAFVLLRGGFGASHERRPAHRGGGRHGVGRTNHSAVTGLLVTNDFPPKIGGIQSYLYELWRRLPVADATVFTTRHDGDTAWDAQQAFRVVRARERQFFPTRSLATRIDALAHARSTRR